MNPNVGMPDPKEILEACAKLLGEELMWVPEKKILLSMNEEPAIMPCLVRLGLDTPWDPIAISAQAFELQIVLDAQVRIDHREKRVFAISGEDYAGIGIPGPQAIFDQARLAICLLAFSMWAKYQMPLKNIRRMQAEALKQAVPQVS